VKKITTTDLCGMTGSEGLILQGCGGDPQEWLDGINEMLTEEGILLEGDTFKEASSFEYGGVTNLLFGMDEVKLDVGRLAMWRLQSHGAFGGTWLSDYVPNKLGGFIEQPQQLGNQKPDAPLIGADGNIFNLMGIASRTLKDNGMKSGAAEMRDRVTSSGSYDEALGIIGEYVNITAADGYEAQDEGEDFCMEEMT
jgi:hypothetical protein